MSKKPDEFGKTTANFRVDPKIWNIFSNIAHEQYGFGGISTILTNLVLEYNNKHEGKSSTKLDTFLDPNFVPKPRAMDDLDKVVVPFIKQMSNQELHELRVWAYQIVNFCAAYQRFTPQRRKVTNLSYDQAIELLGGPQ